MNTTRDTAHINDAMQQGRFDESLHLIDESIAAQPDSADLHWQRANCLEQLGRLDEIRAELDIVLSLKPDHAAAIVKRVQFNDADFSDDDDEDDEEKLSEKEIERRKAMRAAKALQVSQQQEAELRRALEIDPMLAEGWSALSQVMRHRDDGVDREAEAVALLDRAIELEPDNTAFLETRASQRQTSAHRWDDGEDDANTIRTWTGMRFWRIRLEDALADYERVFALSGEIRPGLRSASLLHELGRFGEALARYDEVLAKLSPDDPKREYIVEQRARSENDGAGEREQMAKLIESGLLGDGKDRSLADDMGAQMLRAMSHAMRSGKTVEQALEAHVSEDPDTMMANNIAMQIFNVAHEPPPQLEAVNAAEYPAYQRRHVDGIGRQAQALKLRHVADAEARGLFMTMGQHVLLRFFACDGGKTGVATFALKPKWPGWLGFLVLFLTGKWKVTGMVECVTQFDDGTHFSTLHESPSPFEYADPIRAEQMPKNTPLAKLLERHRARVAAYRKENPRAVATTANDLSGMEARWIEGQRVKRDYRASIGYATDAELKRMLGTHHGRFAEKVKAQLAILASEAGVAF